MNYLEQVEVFNDQFESPKPAEPCIPADRWKLRVGLIEEEAKELREACEAGDVVAAYDAILDILYVTFGAALEFGMKDILAEGFAEVQRSNLSKSCDTREIAENTKHWYATQGTETYIKQVNGKWNVYRSSDNKVLKSIHYFPANLKRFINQ